MKNQRKQTHKAIWEGVDTSTTDKIADVANISTLLDKNNKLE